MRVLNIQASPRGPRSVSIAVSDAFLGAYCEFNPSVEVDTLNVWDESLPEFDGEAIGAKYKGVSREPMNASEEAIWGRIGSLVGRFRGADRILLGVPMWNFADPYKLKQVIDLACQRDMLFTFDGKAYGPMLKIPRALVIDVRGQSDEIGFADSSPGFEHQVSYINFWLRFIGVSEDKILTVEHTWDDRAQETVARGKEQAARLAADFWTSPTSRARPAPSGRRDDDPDARLGVASAGGAGWRPGHARRRGIGRAAVGRASRGRSIRPTPPRRSGA